MLNTVWVNDDNGRGFHPLVDHNNVMTFLPRKKIMSFQHFNFHFT